MMVFASDLNQIQASSSQRGNGAALRVIVLLGLMLLNVVQDNSSTTADETRYWPRQIDPTSLSQVKPSRDGVKKTQPTETLDGASRAR